MNSMNSMNPINPINPDGFTLLEVIITLIVASILGTLLYQFMGTSLTQSSVSVVWAEDQFELNGVMEKMTAHYRNFVVTGGTETLGIFKGSVGSEGSTQSNSYGDYDVVHNKYITFDEDGNETPGGDRILKVTIKKGEQTLTTLFTQ